MGREGRNTTPRSSFWLTRWPGEPPVTRQKDGRRSRPDRAREAYSRVLRPTALAPTAAAARRQRSCMRCCPSLSAATRRQRCTTPRSSSRTGAAPTRTTSQVRPPQSVVSLPAAASRWPSGRGGMGHGGWGLAPASGLRRERGDAGRLSLKRVVMAAGTAWPADNYTMAVDEFPKHQPYDWCAGKAQSSVLCFARVGDFASVWTPRRGRSPTTGRFRCLAAQRQASQATCDEAWALVLCAPVCKLIATVARGCRRELYRGHPCYTPGVCSAARVGAL